AYKVQVQSGAAPDCDDGNSMGRGNHGYSHLHVRLSSECSLQFSVRGTQIRTRSIDDPKLWPVAGSAGQFDRDDVHGRPAGKVQFSPKLTIQLLGIATGQAVGVVDRVFAEPRHLVHIAEHRSTLCLRQGDTAGIESAQAV